MLQLDITIILVICNSLAFFALGYYIRGQQTSKEPHNTATLQENVSRGNILSVQNKIDKLDDAIEDVLSDEPSGIIMRPSSEELNKMNEDKDLKESKEEMARVIREAEEPRV